MILEQQLLRLERVHAEWAHVPRCECGTFRRQGICWHTGYKPTFRTLPPLKAT